MDKEGKAKGMNIDAKGSSTSGDADMEMVWIFTTENFAEAEVITDIFDAEDIAYMVRRMEVPQFPTTVGDHNQIRIAVEDGRTDQARNFIQQAIVDEAVPGDGNFM